MAKLNKKNISEQIVEIIIERIRSKELKPGDRLPSERELAVNLGVSRVSLREALSALNNMGVITTRHGEGTFINEYKIDQDADSFQMYSLLNSAPIQEMMQLRKVIEQETAKQAAIHATDDEIAKIRTYKEMRERKHYNTLSDAGYADKYHEMDTLFHRAIAQATHNSVYVNALDIIRNSMTMHQDRASSRVGMFEITSTHHDEIFWAIAGHNPELASKAMMKHLEEVELEVNRIELEALEKREREALNEENKK